MKVLHYRGRVLLAPANIGGAQKKWFVNNSIDITGYGCIEYTRYYIWLHHGENYKGYNKSSISFSDLNEESCYNTSNRNHNIFRYLIS